MSRSSRWTMPGRASSPPAASAGERVDERRAAVPRHRVHEQARGLVDHHQVLVGVGQRHAEIGRRRARGGGLRLGQGHDRARAEPVRLRPRRAVDEHDGRRRSAARRRPASRRPRAPATNRSRRMPPESGGTSSSITAARARRRVGVDGRRAGGWCSTRIRPSASSADPDHDEAVGEVERRPVADVDEVGDVAVANAGRPGSRRCRRRAGRARPETARAASRSGRSARASTRPRRRSGPTRSPSRPGKIPNAMPLLRTCVIERNGSTRCGLLERQPLLDRALGHLIGDDRSDRDRHAAPPTATTPPGVRAGALPPRGSAPLLQALALDALRRPRQGLQALAARSRRPQRSHLP